MPPFRTALLLFLVASLVGCGGSSEGIYSSYSGTRTLPSTRTIVDPDSLRYVKYTSTSDSAHIKLERPYSKLMRDWSAQMQRGGDLFRPSPFNTFATLQSREITLASLQRRERVNSLSAARANNRIVETLDFYNRTISFQVHLFLDASRVPAPLSTLRNRVVSTLRVDGKQTFDSIRSTQQNTNFSGRGGGEGVFQYQFTVYFDRHPNGRDILKNGRKFDLSVQPFSSTRELVFSWVVDVN